MSEAIASSPPAARIARAGSVVRLGQAKRGAGQRHGDRLAGGQGADILGAGFDQVVGRDGPQLRRQAGPAQVVELIGVNFEGEAQVASRHEIRRLCSRLKAPVSQNTSTKGSGRPGTCPCDPSLRRGQHLAANQVGEGVRAVLVIRGRRRALREKWGPARAGLARQAHRAPPSRPARGGFQSITGLGFGGGRAVAQQRVHPRAGLGQELLARGRAGGLHGREDPAPRREDLQVGLPFQAHLELGRTVASPDQVGVRVDEAGHHDPPRGADL